VLTRTRRARAFVVALALASVACASAASGTKPNEDSREAQSEKRRPRLAHKSEARTPAAKRNAPAREGSPPVALLVAPPGDAALGESPAEEGLASYYADMLAGNRTASGERYRPADRTCAHRTHAFGTLLVVTAVESGKSATCRVNDRGPFVSGRVVDVSKKLAEELGMLKAGVIKVRVEVAADAAEG
jgi:rare lipoprotein A